ncbi:MAG: M1 family aminopeptidase, partial [Myxococcota bacterium]
PPPKAIPSPTVRPSFDAPTMWTQLWARTRIEAASIVRSPAFWLLLALGLFNSIAGMVFSRSLYGLTTYPVTRRLIDILQGSFEFIPVVVMIYYSGELVSRDRRINAHEMIDAAPVPSWVLFVSKLAGLSLVVTSLMTAASLGAMAVQLAQGYTQLELDQYLVRVLLLNNAALILRGVLCLFLQALLGNRWLGMLAMVLYIILDITLSNIGFEDRLYHFADVPPIRYSDMNGYGQFLLPNLAFLAYYFFGSLILSVLAFGLWGRGEVSAPWRRAARLPRQLNRTAVSLLVGAAVLAAGLGSYIYHNTHRLNPYLTRDDEMDRAARYEEKYGELETAPSPKIVGVEAEVDIFPEERRYEVRGRYVLENRTEAPLSMVHVDVPFDLRLKAQALEGAQLDRTDLDLGHYVWKLEAPWPPGERRLLTFETERSHPGFANRDNTSRVTGNGTFFDNGDAMPQLSFAADKLLQDRPERRERGLRKRPRAPRLEDASTYHQGALRTDSDWVTFTTTVSTSRDQIAIAPGYLEKTWVAGGRPHFLYRMDSPIQNFFSYLSGEFAVREEMHGPIKLQVFHHAPHSYNVDGMIDGMKKALDYGSKNLSPFQYRQMRIFEFPSFMGTFAQSFPNSVPYSEAIGFIVDVRDPDEIDAILYVTAHEVAHQWFGHQLSAAPNQGATMLIESFAQYMALMVLEDALGEDVMRRFLKYELDSYLTGRGGELIEELPLYRVENQPYIHYRKGLLAMYALKDYFGEDRVNRVLRRLIAERGFSAEPYPLSTDFLDRLRAEARNDTERRLIEDLFEKIVLFDLKVEEASAVERPDGKWAVDLKVSARKLEADGEGRESEVPLDLPIDIGVFSKSLDGPLDPSPGARGGHVLHLQKQRLTTGTHEIHLVVDERPVVVGVDPYNKLVDRDSEDNLRQL